MPEEKFLNRELFVTEDGSHTIRLPEMNESFHSERGSWQETAHTFIDKGLNYFTEEYGLQELHVFEMGFGSGLNAYQALLWAREHNISLHYYGLEAYPLSKEEWQPLNYSSFSKASNEDFYRLHETEWEEKVELEPKFHLHKTKSKLEDFEADQRFHLVFYDAFAPSVQPELWSDNCFQKIYGLLGVPGIMVTYSAAGKARRAMQRSGFWVQELRGAIGKREMTRALKL